VHLSEVALGLDRFDLVMGNPPYAHGEPFVRAGLSLLTPKGELPFFLRLAFSEGQRWARGLYREFPLAELSVCDRTAAARASLGEKAFDAAGAAGRALSLEDAVALALADPGEG
jgi:hypothetical protein